ncbi:magnesium and cobalt transport protein CorA [Plantactinospora sp. CA-290183]|uniref:magnesium and cobalt transport protein CorA n=1 Tax=Plantactinospora sp. CA-290183 TaxID=3240006 RepID=UPI003D8CD6BE
MTPDLRAGAVRDRLTAPVRRLVAEMVIGGEARPSALPSPRRPLDPVVDCAAYVGGKRLPGQLDYRRALTAARASGGFVWLGLHEPRASDFAPVARAFGLDDLIAEHAVNADHRPAVERYDKTTVIVLRTTRYVEHQELTETSEVVETGAVTVFIGPRFVITVRHGPSGALGPVRANLEAQPALLALGPWAVAQAVCNQLVDSYVQVAAAMQADIDTVEEQVFARYTHDRIAHIYQLKRELMEFKRAIAPLQHPLAALVEDRKLLPKEVGRYFGDVNGTLARTVERVTAYDDLLASVLQARLAQVTVSQNNDMRKIAAWAAIFAVETFIAGIYGMNFEHMPELQMRYGYAGVWLVMVVVAIVLYRGFRRNKWL